MSGRGRVRGTTLRGRQMVEDSDLAGGDFETPDKTNYEEEKEIERGSRSSTRENRLKRRKEQKGNDDDLEKILQASGIDTEGMDPDEKDQLAKVLLQSKSEAEGSYHFGDGTTHTRSESRTSRASSTDSIMFLQENTLKEDPFSLESQDVAEFEDKDTQPAGDNSLNCSMSQIFSQVTSEDDETQPPSPGGLEVMQRAPQTQAQLEARGDHPAKRAALRQRAPQAEHAQSSVRAPLTDITQSNSKNEPVISDCATLIEDMVDGDLPSNSNQSVTHYLSDQDDSEPMLTEQRPSAECLKVIEVEVHWSKLRDSESNSQQSDNPGIQEPQLSVQRKRKATDDSESRPKQSRFDAQSEEDMSFCIGSYLVDGDKSPQTILKPLKRRYRRQRGVTKEKKFYSPYQSREDCNHYTSVILQLLDVYRTKLRDAQYGLFCHVNWGDPVKTGRHMSRTIDLKRRGRHSCYWEDLSETEDEDLENEVQRQGKSPEDKTPICQIKKNQNETGVVSVQNISDDEDFDPVSQKTLPLRKTRGNTNENKSLRISKWLTTRGNTPAKSETKTRKRAVTKPELDFLSDSDDLTYSKTIEKLKDKNIFGKNIKTYSRKSTRKNPVLREDSSELDDVQESPEEVRTLSPILPQIIKDKMAEDNEEEASMFNPVSPLFLKTTSSGGKKSACKTFTFASTDAGKINVSERISQEVDEDGFLPSTQKMSQEFFLKTRSSPKFSKTPSRARKNSEIKETSSKGDYSNSVEDISISGDLDEEISFGKKIIPESPTKERGYSKPRLTSRQSVEEVDNLSDNIVKYQTKSKGVVRQLSLDKKKKKRSIIDLAEDHEGRNQGDNDVDDTEANDDMLEVEEAIPSSALFSGKKRKLSSLFSDNDESFSLGVSPAKAFSAAFESLSDNESPTVGKVDIDRQVATEQQTNSRSPQFGTRINLVHPSIRAHTASDTEEIYEQYETERPETSTSEKMSVKPRNKRTGNVRGQVKRRTPSPIFQNEPVETTDRAGHVAPAHSDETPEAAIACPLCGQEFSVNLIEAHAANCNGDPPGNEVEGVASSSWRVAVETGDDPVEGDQDKCYICDKSFKRGNSYERHVNGCLAEAKRRQEELEKGLGSRRGRATRTRHYVKEQSTSDEDGISFHGNQEGITKKRKVENGSAVVDIDSPSFTPSESESENESERESSAEPEGDKGPNSCQKSRERTADIDFDSVSDSPIKTFRKIGQLDNCLIDFSNQFKKSDKLKRKPVKTGKKRKRSVKKKSKTGRKKSTTKR